ncbi:MAG: extracellular solute-binding protein [Planctomycetota bacterium]
MTLYCALDQQFSQPLLDAFCAEAGIDVRARFDSEASKTVGLFSAIVEEQSRPRCDVFWNNEIAHTVLLAQKGLLEPYAPPSAADVPARWRDARNRWFAFGARARILVVNTEVLPDRASWPAGIRDFADPKWKGRCAIARPLTGTTLTHFTALRKRLGEDEFEKLFEGMIANEVRFLQSNGATLNETAAGNVAFAFTDTDDYNEARRLGKPVACVFPDQEEGGLGAMLIPNSVAVIHNGPHAEAARKLCDFILRRSTEAALARGPGAQIPLRAGIPGPEDPSIPGVGGFRAMDWDVEWTAAHLAESAKAFAARFGL